MAGVRDRVAVVTGAANGLGREIAQVLAREGARVALGDLDAGGLDHTAAAIVARRLRIPSPAISPRGAGQTDDAAVAEFGQIDILINDVGGSRNARIWEMTVEDWDFVLRLNLRSTFLCTRAAVPHMMRRRPAASSHVLEHARHAVDRVLPGGIGALGGKAGVHGFVRDVALELSEHGISVNAVAPGPIDTERWPRPAEARRTVEYGPNRMTPLRQLGCRSRWRTPCSSSPGGGQLHHRPHAGRHRSRRMRTPRRRRCRPEPRAAGPFCSTMLATGASVIARPAGAGDIARSQIRRRAARHLFREPAPQQKGIEVDLKIRADLFFRLSSGATSCWRTIASVRWLVLVSATGRRRAQSRHHLLLRLGFGGDGPYRAAPRDLILRPERHGQRHQRADGHGVRCGVSTRT
jgi:3-oxoacyl-[acyl-carrier protein] reductase